MVEAVRENTGDSNQHVLVIGPRGSGKTTLLHRVAAEIRREPDLAELWYPVLFAEESYEVTCAGEFWLEAVCQIGIATNESGWKETYAELRKEFDNERLEARALAQLLDFANAQGKRIVLLVENLNMLTDQFDQDEEWTLRHALLNEPRLMLIASATSRFDAIDHEGRAFFEVFRKIQLERLSAEECASLWASVTGQPVTQERVRPIEIFTGGNPRLLTIVASFGAGLSLRELIRDLTQLVDDHTEYFKSHLDGLATKERKVYLALAELWFQSTAREVAEAARMEVNITSSLLKRLADRGAVVSEKRGAKKLYGVAERMYNIYYLMRRHGSSSSSRVDAAVNFMIGFYAPSELPTLTKSIASEAAGLELQARREHQHVYSSLLKRAPSDAVRAEMLKDVSDEFLADLEISESSKRLRSTRPSSAVPKSDFTPTAWVAQVADVARSVDPKVGSEKLLGDIVEANDDSPDAHAAAASCLEILDRNEEAAWRWNRIGTLHENFERYDETEAAYRKAIDLDPEFGWAWTQLGRLLGKKLGGYDEAEAAYRKAIDLDPEFAWPWVFLGNLLHEKLARHDEAEAAYRKAIGIDSTSWAWAGLYSLIMGQPGRAAEGLELADETIANLGRIPSTLNALAWSLRASDSRRDIARGIEWAREALVSSATDSDRSNASHTLACLLCPFEETDEALQLATTWLEGPDDPPVGDLADLSVSLAAAGATKPALAVLRDSRHAARAEPLVVALEMFAGEETRAPQEIVEVAHDIRAKIRAEQERSPRR